MWKICCFFFFLLALQNAHSCIATNSHIVAGKYDRKMENIVYVGPLQQHSFHIRSEGKKTAIWNKACTEWNKKQNLRWLHLSHSHWGSYRDDEPLLLQPSSRSIPGIRPLRSFESATCTIDMLLFFICWLYLIPSLFPLTEQRGSYSRPNSNLCFFCSLGLVLIYIVVEVCVAVHSLCLFVWALFGVLQDCVLLAKARGLLRSSWMFCFCCEYVQEEHVQFAYFHELLLSHVLSGYSNLLYPTRRDCPWLVKMTDVPERRLTEKMRFSINSSLVVFA